MTLPQIIVIVIVIIPLGLTALNRLRVDIAALIIAAALGTAQLLGLGILGNPNTPADASKAITGLSQPVIVTLFGLFIITRCLDRTGVTRWIARSVLSLGGHSEGRLIALFAATTAVLSLVMNNLAAGALILPSALDVARRTKINPSKLLIPVAYGSLLGGVATYFTTANIITSDLLVAAKPPQTPLHVLDFTPTGGLMAIAGIAFLAAFGRRLLPDRAPSEGQLVARRTGSELEDVYQLGERMWEAQVQPGSQAAGKSLMEIGIGERLGLAVAAIWHGKQAIFAPAPSQRIQAGDILLTIGREERVSKLAEQGMKIGREGANGHISSRGVSFVEVLLAPHSSAEGKTLKELEFRRLYGFTGVALQRGTRSYRTDVADFKLEPGDAVLMVGARSRRQALKDDPNFVVLEPDISDQPTEWNRALPAILITLGAVIASVAGVPVFLSMLVGAILVILLGLVPMDEAYRTMEWPAIFLIAGMYSLSLAMVNTGLAGLIGQGVVGIVTPFGPLGLAAGAYLLSAVLTQVMGGQVTALVTAPITISAAITLHVDPQAIAVATAIGCSASFLTPIAHPVNVLMIGPGNYRFSDFFRVGWILTIICFVMLLLGMVLFWRL